VTAAEHPNAVVVRRAYDAAARGDAAGLAALIAPGAQWSVPGRSQVAGEYRGREEVFAFLGRLRELSGNTLHVELSDVAGSDQHGVALQRVTATREGRHLDVGMCVVYRVDDGLLTRARYFVDDQAAYDAFWS
jgi:uncharacterized protein